MPSRRVVLALDLPECIRCGSSLRRPYGHSFADEDGSGAVTRVFARTVRRARPSDPLIGFMRSGSITLAREDNTGLEVRRKRVDRVNFTARSVNQLGKSSSQTSTIGHNRKRKEVASFDLKGRKNRAARRTRERAEERNACRKREKSFVAVGVLMRKIRKRIWSQRNLLASKKLTRSWNTKHYSFGRKSRETRALSPSSSSSSTTTAAITIKPTRGDAKQGGDFRSRRRLT